MSEEITRLREGAEALGCPLSEQQAHSLVRYLDELEIANRSFNLTRIPREDYVTLHLLDSLAAQQGIKAAPGMKLLDIGTGAGFPGIPLAAANPTAQVTLLDSTAKKVLWAASTAERCGVTNCRALHARAEALATSPEHRGRYDVVISRAVASFDVLIKLMLPFVARGGRAIALKGAKAREELKGTAQIITKLGGSPAQLLPVHLPGSDAERYLIVVGKQR